MYNTAITINHKIVILIQLNFQTNVFINRTYWLFYIIRKLRQIKKKKSKFGNVSMIKMCTYMYFHNALRNKKNVYLFPNLTHFELFLSKSVEMDLLELADFPMLKFTVSFFPGWKRTDTCFILIFLIEIVSSITFKQLRQNW